MAIVCTVKDPRYGGGAICLEVGCIGSGLLSFAILSFRAVDILGCESAMERWVTPRQKRKEEKKFV